MENSQNKFAEEIRRLRQAKNLSQDDLAVLCGLTAGAIGHIEVGRRGVRAEVLFALCRALEVPCSHFEPFFPKIEKKEKKK